MLRFSLFPLSILALAFASQTVARADILFLNLNHSYGENESIRAAAKATQQRAWSFPSFETEAERVAAAKAEEIDSQIKELNTKYFLLQYQADDVGILGWLFSAKNRRIVRDARAISQKMKALEAQKKKLALKGFTLEDVNAKVAELDRQGARVTALVISSHSTGEIFWGEKYNNGKKLKLVRDDILKLTKNHPALFSRLEKIIFLACSTGEAYQLLNWGELMADPKHRIVAGFTGSAPSRIRSESQNIVKNILKTQDSFLDQNPDQEQVKQWFKSLDRGADETNLSVLVNNWVGGTATKLKFRSTSDLSVDCKVGADLVNAGWRDYSAYFNPNSEDFNSIDPSDQHSRLRIFYRNLQKYVVVCKKEFVYEGLLGTTLGASYLPTREQVIALIHFSNLQMAFVHERGDEMDAFNSSFKRMGAKETMLLPEKMRLGGLKRKEIIALFDRIDAHVTALTQKYSGKKEKLAQVQMLKATATDFRSQLVELKNIPVNWITFE